MLQIAEQLRKYWFSFNGNKIITCGGGGAILTQSKVLADKARYLVTQAKTEQKELREELQKVLDELTYQKITEIQKTMVTNTLETGKTVPMHILVG